MRARSQHFVINGFDGLTYRLAEQLSARYDAEVVVVMSKQDQLKAHDFGELQGVEVMAVDRVTEDTLREAGAASAAGLALTVQDDVGNIHRALQAREIAEQVRLVVRMYNTDLGQSVERLLGNCKVLSDAEIAAPVLVALALGEVAATPVTVARRALMVADRADVLDIDIVCGLADTSNDEPRVLPSDEAHADLVLAEQRRSSGETTLRLSSMLPKRPSWLNLALTFARTLVTRKSRIAVSIVLAIIVAAGAALGASLDLRPWEAFYFAAVTVFGGPEPDPELGAGQQALQLVLGLAGLAFIPLVTALIVEGIVRARLAVAQVRLIHPHADHVVVVGLGGVGTRLIRLLNDRGVRVVAVAADEQARGVPLARELGIPLVIGDAGREATLRLAGAPRCRALMAVSKSDAANLETALHGRNLQPNLHVVLRVFDGDLAARIGRTFDLPLSRSVSYLAAPAFAEALMDREVIGTISVRRRVLLLAEISVPSGSALDGVPIADIQEPGLVRVIAVTEFGEPRPLWKPSPARRIGALDRLTVVATRDGLSRLVQAAH